jgi:hypothetical protein
MQTLKSYIAYAGSLVRYKEVGVRENLLALTAFPFQRLAR